MSGKTLAWTTLVLAAFAAISPADASPDLPTNYCRANLRTRTLDALHRELKVVDAEGGAVETRFDAVNRRWLSDPRKYETWLSYDAVNRPTGQEDHAPGGSLLYTQTTTYRDALRKEEHVSRAGLSTLTTRDGLGRGVRVERSGTGDDGVKLSAADLSEFDAAGNVTLKTDGNGHATRSEFDGLGRKVAETLADGTAVAARTTSTYDKAGNRLEVKGPRGTWAYDLHQDYDDLNRPVRTVDATGAVRTTAFDAGGNKACELRPSGGDPLGTGGAAGKSIDAMQALACGKPASTGFTYDELGKLTKVETAAGLTTFVYDEVRNLVAKQDANAHLTTYGYDRANHRTDEWQQLDAQARLTSRSQGAALQATVLPDAGFTTGTLHWSASYDAAGNVTQVTEPKGDVRVSTYGALNRLEATTFTTHDKPLGVLVPTSTSTGYDGDGKVKTVTQVKVLWRTFFDVDSTVSEVTTSEHDGLGRLWREHRYDGKVVEYAHDLKGNRKKVTDPDGVETFYDFDAADRLATVTTPRGAATYAHWPDGLRKATSLPNGLGEGRCYDQVGRLTAIVTRTGAVADTCPDTLQDQSRFRYGYDANGNRSTQREWRTDPATQALGAVEETGYGYDAIDRLVGVQYPGGKAELYRLDPVGNRTGERELSGAALSAAELTSFEPPAGATLVRDVTGNFNRADWLLSLTDAKDAARSVALGWTASGELLTKTTATVSRQLTWDGRGALVAVADNGTEVGRYDYDADGLRVKRRTSSEAVEYVLDDTHVLQEADANVLEHPAYRRYHYGAEPLMVVDGARARFIGTDALGSPTDLTGTTGQVEVKRQYDAWGKYRNGTAPGAGEAKLGFTGHQFDPETGLVYARARYYDPEIGRFISRDALDRGAEDAPNLHRFTWARGNPLRFSDPSGFAEEEAGPVADVQAVTAAEEGGQGPECYSNTGGCPSGSRQDASRDDVKVAQVRKNAPSRRATAEESRSGPGTDKVPVAASDDVASEVQASRRYLAGTASEASERAKPVVQAAVEFVFSAASAAATLETGKSFWGGDATPEEMRQAKEIVAATAAAPFMVGAVAKYGGKLWAWGKKKGGSLFTNLFARGEKVAEEARDAASALNGAKLKEYLRQAEEYGAGGVKDLENGKYRFYGELVPASKSGEMAGRRVVREWDPATGAKRTWHETVDHQGNIRQVRPDTSVTGGQKVHYVFDENGKYKEEW